VKKWVEPLEDPVAPPLATDGIRAYASSADGIRAMELATGVRSWLRSGLTGAITAAPGLVVVRSESGLVTALDPPTGKTRWSARTARPSTLPAVIDAGRVLLAGERLLALDATTGRVLGDEPLPSLAVLPPVAAPGRLLVGMADATLRCLDATTFRVLWSYALKNVLEAPPAVDDRRVVVGTADRRVVALDLKNGHEDWTFKLGATVSVAPTITPRYALVASKEALLYAFGRGHGDVAWLAPLSSRPLGSPVVIGSKVFIACHPDDLLGFELATGKAAGNSHARVDTLDPTVGASEVRAAPVVVPPFIVVGIRNPWALVGLQPGAAPKPPSPPPSFPPDLADAPPPTPSPSTTPTATPTVAPTPPSNP
jgi:outer membrane protein assembly factor BamB